MQIRPIGSNEVHFPYKKRGKINCGDEMVYEPKENPLFPQKLKAIIIIPESDTDEEETDDSKDTFNKTQKG